MRRLPRDIPAPQKRRFPRLQALSEGCMTALTGAALGSLLLFGPGCSATTQGANLQRPIILQEEFVIQGWRNRTGLDWGKTHMLILNGDREARHLKNTRMAIEAGLSNKAASIYMAGISERIPEGVSHFKGDDRGIREMVIQASENSKEGDTFLIYVTGHGERDAFIKEDGSHIGHKAFLKILLQGGRERSIMFISDACYSANFVDMLMRSGLPDVTAMSPGLENEQTTCDFFARPYWHAIKSGMDLDSDNVATIEEAFYYAMNRYRRLDPWTSGTYRKSIPMIRSLDEVADGVVMITSDYCGACKMMEPIFNAASLLSKGSIRFYKIDIEDTNHQKGIPALILMKGGRKVTTSVGARDIKGLRSWLGHHGISTEDFRISLKALYEQGRYESIVQISNWPEMKGDLGAKRSLKVLTSQICHADPAVRISAMATLLEMSVEHDIGNIPAVRDRVARLIGDDDKIVRINANTWFLSHAISKQPAKLAPIINSGVCMDERTSQGKLKKIEDAMRSVLPRTPAVRYSDPLELVLTFHWALTSALSRDPDKVMPYMRKMLRTQNRCLMISFPEDVLTKSAQANPGGMLPHLERLARSKSSDERAVAAEALGYASVELPEERQRSVMPIIKALLSDRDALVRSHAAVAIARNARKSDVGAHAGIIEGLGRLLDDPDLSISMGAVQALQLIGKRHTSEVRVYSSKMAKVQEKANAYWRERQEKIRKRIIQMMKEKRGGITQPAQ